MRMAVGVEDSSQSAYKSLLIGGCTAVGASVYDLGECDRNAFRFTVRNSRLDGGIFVACDKIYLYGNDGLLLYRDRQRAFEYAFSQRSFLLERTGVHRLYSNYMPLYEARIKKYLINARPVNMRLYASDFLCRVITVMPEPDAEKLYVGDTLGVDDWSPETVKCAVSLAYGSMYGRVYIPYSYPSVIESIGNRCGFDVVRMTSEDPDRRRLYDMTDANIMAAVLVNCLSRRKTTFRRLAESLPRISTVSKQVVCSDVCRTFDRLCTDTSLEREFGDGVRFIDKKNARDVRIVPEQSIRGFKIIAEAGSFEAANEICDIYVNKIGGSVEKD